MADLLQQAAAWLNQQRHAHVARTVTYRRGATSINVAATVGKTVFRLDMSGGGGGEAGTIRVVTRDYLIRAVDLVMDGQPILPRRGDEIDEVINGVTVTHEVHAPGTSGGEPEWRYSDAGRITMRIHTMEVDQS